MARNVPPIASTRLRDPLRRTSARSTERTQSEHGLTPSTSPMTRVATTSEADPTSTGPITGRSTSSSPPAGVTGSTAASESATTASISSATDASKPTQTCSPISMVGMATASRPRKAIVSSNRAASAGYLLTSWSTTSTSGYRSVRPARNSSSAAQYGHPSAQKTSTVTASSAATGTATGAARRAAATTARTKRNRVIATRVRPASPAGSVQRSRTGRRWSDHRRRLHVRPARAAASLSSVPGSWAGVSARLRSGLSGDGVGERADLVDGDRHRVARPQVAGRVETGADPGGRAGGDHVTGLEGDHLGQGGDQGGDVEDQVGDAPALAELPIDLGPQLEPGDVVDLVGGDDPGAHGTERVDGLAD